MSIINNPNPNHKVPDFPSSQDASLNAKELPHTKKPSHVSFSQKIREYVHELMNNILFNSKGLTKKIGDEPDSDFTRMHHNADGTKDYANKKWNENSEGLYVMLHGPKKHPAIWCNQIAELKDHHADADQFIPFVKKGSEDAIVEKVIEYAKEHPGKPICILGSHNSALCQHIESQLSSKVPGVKLMISLVGGEITPTTHSETEEVKDSQPGLPIEPGKINDLIKPASLSSLTSRKFEYFGNRKDFLALPKADGKLLSNPNESYHLVSDEKAGKETLVGIVTEAQIQSCFHWMKEQSLIAKKHDLSEKLTNFHHQDSLIAELKKTSADLMLVQQQIKDEVKVIKSTIEEKELALAVVGITPESREELTSEIDQLTLLLSTLSQELNVADEESATHITLLKNIMQTLPETEDEMSAQLPKVPLEVVAHALRTQVVPAPEVTNVVNNTGLYKELFADLDRLKDKLGGSPNFKSTPQIDDADDKRTFFGIPLSAAKDWVRLAIKQKRSPLFIYKAIAWIFGVKADALFSKYEEAHIRIQRFEKLINNKDRFFKILKDKNEDRYGELSTITGLAWHPNLNGPGTEKIYIELIEQFLTIYYEDAKAKGDDALIKYFNAFDGVCFEARAKVIEEYIGLHPVGDQAAAINETKNVIDIDPKKPATVAFDKVLMDLGESATPKSFLDAVKKTNIFDTAFPKDGALVKPTLEDFHVYVLGMIEAYVMEAYETEDLLNIELEIFNQSGTTFTKDNFITHLGKRQELLGDDFSVESDDVQQFIQSKLAEQTLEGSA